MTSARAIVVVCLLTSVSATIDAQTQPAPPEATAQPSAAPTPPDDYTYSPGGRRDPFVRTIGRTAGPVLNLNARPEGLAGLLVSEIVVRGFLESRGTWVAMVGAPNGRSYTLRAGDRVMDGIVRAITSDAVVFLQQVNDPLSSAKQREVRKYLRGGEQVR